MNNLLKGFIIVILSTLFTSCSSHQGIKSVTADEFENTLYDGHVQLLKVRAAELGANAIVGMRPLQNLTPFSIILVFEHYWLTRSQYF